MGFFGDQLDAAKSAMGIGPITPRPAPTTSSSPSTSLNLAYTVYINQADGGEDKKGLSVLAYLPDTFNFDLQSEYTSPFAEPFIKQGDLLDKGAKLAGISTITQEMTAQFWSGNSHVSFNLPLVFVATSSPDEITGPLSALLQMSLPTRHKNGFLSAPGPRPDLNAIGKALAAAAEDMVTSVVGTSSLMTSITNLVSTSAVQSGNTKLKDFQDKGLPFDNSISIIIGNFLFFNSVIIKNVQQTFASRFDANGYPMKVEVNVTVETFLAPTAADMMKSFKGVPRGKPVADTPLNAAGPGSPAAAAGSRSLSEASALAIANGTPTPITFPPK